MSHLSFFSHLLCNFSTRYEYVLRDSFMIFVHVEVVYSLVLMQKCFLSLVQHESPNEDYCTRHGLVDAHTC